MIQSNLYITVTLGKWPGDRYIQGDRCTQVSFKLPQKSINSIFMYKLSLNLRFSDNNEPRNRNAIIRIKKAYKMSAAYFYGGAVYSHLSFLVGKAFNVIIDLKKIGYSSEFRSSKLDFM